MNREDIIRMAREAELLLDIETTFPYAEGTDIGPMLEKFAALVAAEKDEEIARLQGEIDRMHRDLATIIKGVMRGQPQ